MSDEHRDNERYVEEVEHKVERMSRARSRPANIWRHVIDVGALGFVFVLPVVAGAMVGRALARWTGQSWLAIATLLLGLAIGAYGAWRHLERSLAEE